MVKTEGFSAEQLRLFDTGSVNMAKLRERREALKVQDRAAQTVAGYESDWRIFTRWCEDIGRDPLPATAETVSLYMVWLLDERGLKVSSCGRHLSTIRHYHRSAGLQNPATEDVRNVLNAVRRERQERTVGKLAVSAENLGRAASACDKGTALGLRDRATLVLGFASSLRRSELAGLDLSDVNFEREGITVMLRRSKTDQKGRGRMIGVWAGKRANTDPVRVLKAWIAARGKWAGPLFSQITKSGEVTRTRLAPESINLSVKRCLARIGLDVKQYGAHSLRAGAVTTAAELGRSDQEIMHLSGHESPTVMKMYVRRARAFGGRNPLAGVL